MKLSLLSSSALVIGISSQFAYGTPNAGKAKGVRPRRTSSLFINPAAQPVLPTLNQATVAAASVSLNLSNIQGDILVGMKKKKELFFFFTINDPVTFKKHLGSDIASLITSTTQLLSVSTQPLTAVNIAFSQKGLNAIGATDSLGDQFFNAGQVSDAGFLGDPGTSNWVSAFTAGGVHGVFLCASDTVDNVNAEIANIQSILGTSITEVHRLLGESRPGDQEGHEHFGFMDGISQPAVNGFTSLTTLLPGQIRLDPGLFILGKTGDTLSTSRPSWSVDGSFLAFRQLKQNVPEFDKFLTDNALNVPGLTPKENAELLGARMVGRWKSGAPVDLAPLRDDPVLAADPRRNNNFNFTHPGKSLTTDQDECPFSAHIRKTRPRADFNPENIPNHIIRSGIPYGPEVTDEEAQAGASSTDANKERGLAFVAYQSQIGNGFRFLQHTWANNVNFIFGKNDSTPGFDPIIGANAGQPRNTSGLDPENFNHDLTMNIDFVVSRGGEYFFSPSIAAITGKLSN